MDTAGLIRSGIRGLLKAAGAELGAELRSHRPDDDDSAAVGKSARDYDDAAARQVQLDVMAKHAMALPAPRKDARLTSR
jgi:hypothetical protein